MFGIGGNSLSDQYNPNEGMDWNYQGPEKFNLLDWILGRKYGPREPAELYGLDMPLGQIPQDRPQSPIRANYEILKQYNPYIANEYAIGNLEDWEAQQLINNGNIQQNNIGY